jgi:hypothetical protein
MGHGALAKQGIGQTGHGAWGMGHWAWGIGNWAWGISNWPNRALAKQGIGPRRAWGIGPRRAWARAGHWAWARAGHTSQRLRTAIDTQIFKEVWDLDLLFFYK